MDPSPIGALNAYSPATSVMGFAGVVGAGVCRRFGRIVDREVVAVDEAPPRRIGALVPETKRGARGLL
jgi:hypothetical protein